MTKAHAAQVKKTTETKLVTDMQKAVADLREEISTMSMQLAKAALKNTTSLKRKKDELARLLTKMNMNNIMNKKGATE